MLHLSLIWFDGNCNTFSSVPLLHLAGLQQCALTSPLSAEKQWVATLTKGPSWRCRKMTIWLLSYQGWQPQEFAANPHFLAAGSFYPKDAWFILAPIFDIIFKYLGWEARNRSFSCQKFKNISKANRSCMSSQMNRIIPLLENQHEVNYLLTSTDDPDPFSLHPLLGFTWTFQQEIQKLTWLSDLHVSLFA